jgi:hypothetical protein
MTVAGEEVTIRDLESVVTADTERYSIRVRGRHLEDGRWIGWIDFESQDGSRVLHTDRETTQPNRDALLYWASGLEPLYFEGAFARSR